MKSFTKNSIILIWFIVFWITSIFSIADANSTWSKTKWFSWQPIQILGEIKSDANSDWDRIQNTKFDPVNSSSCNELWVDSRFSLSRTLCFLKQNLHNYLQYVMYIWLSLATIFLIRNWFQLVTSSDREKQIWAFKKNLTYIIIWVILLVSFYYIIDIFVSLVNLVAE